MAKEEKKEVAAVQPGVVVTGGKAGGVSIGGKAYTVKRKITLPLLKHAPGQTVAFTAESAVFVGKEIKGEGDKAREKPADLVNIINLETGEEMQYIVAAVVKANLEELYPGDKLIGHSFAIIKSAEKVPGKRYFDYGIVEIEAAK